MALAAMAIVGCSSEDVSDFTAKQATNEDSRLVELNPNFVLAGVGEEGDMTRTHWEQDPTTKAFVNKFLPIYNATAAAGQNLDVAAELLEQAVGLCWLGNGTVGTDVYTNYQFYHFGWLNKGETEADIDDCPNPTLYNGSLYSDITNLAAVTNGAGGEADPTLDFVGSIPPKSLVGGVGADNLNYNSGVYQTKNKAIFGGQYIVYYPFDENFKDAGTIPAKAETVFNNVSQAWTTPAIGHATFRYSSPVEIKGGAQAANFALYNLSTIVQLRVALPAGVATIGNIDQIVLHSASGKLLKQANLAADRIVAGQKGEALYADKEGTKTIVANFGAPVALMATDANPTSAYITVLPTTVDDLEALVYSSTLQKWARVEIGATTFGAGKAQRLDIPVTAADFQGDYIAVDNASLAQAITDAEAEIAGDLTATPTITVIGDITLTTPAFNINNLINHDDQITITGGDIIVPEGITLTVNTNMESKVRVLGTSCCSGAVTGGRFVVQGGTINDVTMEPTEARVTPATYDAINPMVTYDDNDAGTTITAAGTVDVQAGNVVVNSAVAHKGNITIAEDAKLTVVNALVAPLNYTNRADIQFMGSTVDNYGTIEVEKNGKFDMTDANGNAHASDGWRMTNEATGKFIHNVDAGVGTAVQSMTPIEGSEYRCRVDDQIKLDDAFQQWTACSVIEMVNTGAVSYNLATGEATIAYKHNNKYIDFEVNSGAKTTFYDPNANGDGKTIQIGNLTVTKGGLDIDFNKGTGNRRTLTVNGDMVVKDNTTIIQSKKINITGNLTVKDGKTLSYEGKTGAADTKVTEDGLAVTKDITVSGATFDASQVDAIKITCANFYLEKDGAVGSIATFGNRSGGADMTMDVTGTISNPEDCSFQIAPATGGNVLARIECTELLTGGAFSAARPKVK